jgi:hypothetical protein
MNLTLPNIGMLNEGDVKDRLNLSFMWAALTKPCTAGPENPKITRQYNSNKISTFSRIITHEIKWQSAKTLFDRWGRRGKNGQSSVSIAVGRV